MGVLFGPFRPPVSAALRVLVTGVGHTPGHTPVELPHGGDQVVELEACVRLRGQLDGAVAHEHARARRERIILFRLLSRIRG